MGKILCYGESLVDILLNENGFIGGMPGGSVINTVISLSRPGTDIRFHPEVGDDAAGRFIIDFLNHNQLDTSGIRHIKGRKTPLALALLDRNRETHYSFYRSGIPDETSVPSTPGPVELHTRRCCLWKPVPPRVPVSTIVAGITFNAGLLFGLSMMKARRKDLPEWPEETWDRILDIAMEMSAIVCQSTENYISEDHAREIQEGNASTGLPGRSHG